MSGERRVLSDDRLWTVEDVAYYLGVPVQTVYWWRGAGKGPPGRRVGKRVRYRGEDVKAWFASLSVGVSA
jgi:excisionase family DNA binding protein